MHTLTHIAHRLSAAMRRTGRALRRVLCWGWRVAVRLALLALLLGILGNGTVRDTSLRARTTALARSDLFDYVGWEVDALWGKGRQELLGTQVYLDEAAQRPLVIQFLTTLSQVQDIEAQIEQTYADPSIADPAVATAGLRTQRDTLRADLAARQPLVEGIIEGQVSAVLVDEGFEVLGQVLPPVSMHFTEIPMLLAVSPRDRIELAVDLNIKPITVEEREALEARVDQQLDVSSLVVPLGGISLYPSMIVEPASRDLPSKLARAYEVTAHEWVHHYLTFFPLGWEYTQRAETRIINETTATFFGREIAQKVMARYYPDLLGPVYPSFLNTPPSSAQADAEPAPPAFDFYRELNQTRVHVDELLGEGQVAAAERYMEAQRRTFVSHGYAIRKLNQAYLAFYGGYQGQPGAGGADPIGPAIEELRLLSPDVRRWVQTMRHIATRDELLAALAAARGQ